MAAAAKGYRGQSAAGCPQRVSLPRRRRVRWSHRLRWPFPVAVFELENSPVDDPVGYSLWKVLCRSGGGTIRFRVSTGRRGGDRPRRRPRQSVIGGLSIADRIAIAGETTLIVGNRGGAETFPYGYFRAWRLDTNTGRFERS